MSYRRSAALAGCRPCACNHKFVHWAVSIFAAETDLMDTSCRTHLQRHYDTMWDGAFSAAASGNIDCDSHLAAGPDPRRGLTLIARPGAALQARFDSLLDRLAGAEPHQYRYPAADMHVTILSLVTVADDPAPHLLHLADYHACARAALAGIPSFEIDFHGITMSRGAVLAQGFPRGRALQDLRDRLRTQSSDHGLDASLDQRYRLITAHATLLRFVAPLQDPRRYAALLASLRHEPLGCMRVDAVELVTNDWYMSSGSVERVAVLPLHAPTPGAGACVT